MYLRHILPYIYRVGRILAEFQSPRRRLGVGTLKALVLVELAVDRDRKQDW